MIHLKESTYEMKRSYLFPKYYGKTETRHSKREKLGKKKGLTSPQ
jgi:hypothetical protein